MHKNKNCRGIPKAIHDSIMMCDAVVHKYLFANIVLSGGNTMFLGMADRIHEDVAALAPQCHTGSLGLGKSEARQNSQFFAYAYCV